MTEKRKKDREVRKAFINLLLGSVTFTQLSPANIRSLLSEHFAKSVSLLFRIRPECSWYKAREKGKKNVVLLWKDLEKFESDVVSSLTSGFFL